MRRWIGVVGVLVLISFAAIGGAVYWNVRDFLQAKPPVERRKAAEGPVEPSRFSRLTEAFSQPASEPKAPEPAPVAELSPERRKLVEAYQEEAKALRDRYREENPGKRPGKDVPPDLSPEERREWKKAGREARRALRAQEREELELLRAKYGVTRDEENAYFMITLQEKRQAVAQKQKERNAVEMTDSEPDVVTGEEE